MERLAISFYFSKFHDEFKPEDFQEYRDLRDEYEKSLTEEDLTYLIENSDKENAIKHYQELLAKVQGGQQPEGSMRFEKEEEGKKEEEVPEGEENGDGNEPETEEKVEEKATATEETRQGEETVTVEAKEEEKQTADEKPEPDMKAEWQRIMDFWGVKKI